jgi:hypothetical protein
LKLEAKEPSMEEAMRCELKLPVKRTARIRCGGRVLTGAIASRNPIKDNDLYIWDEQPKERTPNGDGNDGGGGDDNGGATTAGTMVKTMAMTTPSDCIRCVVELAVNPSRISTRRSVNVSKPWKR